jgi:uncharacterized SAM-binding protein YcdF (DUF218 family)
LVAILIATALVGGALLALNIVTTAHSQDSARTDALVVLGAAQFNGRPSPVLANRSAHALTLFESGVASHIITVGSNQPGDLYTEAGTAASWLRAQGVPAEAVYALPVGKDTLSSLQAVARLAVAKHWTSITIVTDAAHAARSAQIARDLGLRVRTAPTHSGPGSALTLRYFTREFLSSLHYFFAERPSVTPIVESH